MHVSTSDLSINRKRSFHVYGVLFENFTSLISTPLGLKMVPVYDRTFYDRKLVYNFNLRFVVFGTENIFFSSVFPKPCMTLIVLKSEEKAIFLKFSVTPLVNSSMGLSILAGWVAAQIVC